MLVVLRCEARSCSLRGRKCYGNVTSKRAIDLGENGKIFKGLSWVKVQYKWFTFERESCTVWVAAQNSRRFEYRWIFFASVDISFGKVCVFDAVIEDTSSDYASLLTNVCISHVAKMDYDNEMLPVCLVVRSGFIQLIVS